MKTLPDRLTIPLSSAITLEMILVRPGYFIMGDAVNGSDYTSEKIERIVHITQPFYLAKYPMTQAQWGAVMQDNHESYFPGVQRPVESISWNDIVEGNQDDNGTPAFFSRLNTVLSAGRPDIFATHRFNLPTEAQWEYAAKGGPRYTLEDLKGKQAIDLYSTYSGSDRLESCGWFEDNSHGETKPVGLKVPNELGFYDMSGNVWEWCLDTMAGALYEKQENKIFIDPVNLKGGVGRVVRGGTYWDNARYCRVSFRGSGHPTFRDDGIGFRVVLSPSSGSGAAGWP